MNTKTLNLIITILKLLFDFILKFDPRKWRGIYARKKKLEIPRTHNENTKRVIKNDTKPS